MTIFVSGGHNAHAPGVRYGMIAEHDLTSVWATMIADKLVRAGINAKLVPFVSLKNKIIWINSRSHPGDIAVELHINSVGAYDPQAPSPPSLPVRRGTGIRGCQVNVWPRSRAKTIIGDPVHGMLEQMFRAKFPGYRGRGVRETQERNYFCRKTKAWSAIIEVEWIWNVAYLLYLERHIVDSVYTALRNIETGPVLT